MSECPASLRVPKHSGRGLPSSESLEVTPAKCIAKKAPLPKKAASPRSSSSSLVSGSSCAHKSSATSVKSPTPEALTKNLNDNRDHDYEQLDCELKEDKEEAEEEEKEESEGERPAKHRKVVQVKDPGLPIEITYNIHYFSASDMFKLGKKPQPKGSSILKLLNNITFTRFERKDKGSKSDVKKEKATNKKKSGKKSKAHGTNDEETPPSHTIFSGNSNSGLASKTILQHRAAAAINQALTAAGPTIHTHNNFTIPDGFLDLFRPAAIALPQPAPIAQPYEPQLTLIPPGMNPMGMGQQQLSDLSN
ncbi:hypothetical protein B0H14DRAFT_3507274 [Mycena olivaceomarginata]|nr:hypothetical protein B0H14DRAFT_3507274 [Mycena olivaceomarginata]